MKRCSKCGEEKSLDQFGNDKSRKDGLCLYCKPCARARYTEWREANLERARESGRKRQQAYYERDPQRVAETVRAYQKRNPELVAERNKNWRASNPETAREGQNRRSKSYRANNKAAIARRAAKRRCDLLNRSSLLTPEKEKQVNALYGLAQYLTEKFGTPYHVDHIVPLRGKTCSGLHVPENLRVVPAQLNLSKGAKIDYELVPHAFRTDTANDA